MKIKPASTNNLPEEIKSELETFIEQANAIIEDDLDKILKSGFLNIENYKNSEGKLYKNYKDSASDDYRESLKYKATHIMTAYDIDRDNHNVDKDNSISCFDNLDKSYLVVTIREDHMYGDVIFSNTGDVFIQAFDKEYNQLHFEEMRRFNNEEIIEDTHNLALLANDLAKHSGNFRECEPDRNIDELAYYFRIAESNFYDDESVKDFRLQMLVDLNGQEMGYPVNATTVTEDLRSSLEEYNSILLHEGENEKDKSFIYEIDGNIFIYETTPARFDRDREFKYISEGDEFTFKGEDYVAELGVLKVMEMTLYTDFNLTSNHMDADEPEQEPEVKKTRTRKPGM